MEKHTLKQPKVFYFSVATSIFERHSYYVLGIILTLFAKSVYGYSDKDAFLLFGLFTALGYVTPIIGGYISDNLIGIKRCMGFGLVLDFLGFLFLAIPNEIPYSFQISLALIIVGSGLFKTCPTNLLARGYEENDPRIDGGFTLYYMGMNVGGFLASFTGSSYTIFGWHLPFLLATVGLFFGIVWFFYFRHQADECEVAKGHEHFHMTKWFIMTVLSILLVIIISFLLIFISLGNLLFYATCIAVVAYFIYEFIISSKNEKNGILVCWILMLFALVGSLLYFQGFTSMELYMERCVNRNISGFVIPTVWFTSLNPVWIFILSPFLAILYKSLGEKNKDLTIPNKFALGVFLIAIGFFVLCISIVTAVPGEKSNLFWLILVYFFYSAGELLSSALGFAMVAHIAPKRLYGTMTGAWFLITNALAANLSGSLANLTSISKSIEHNMTAVMNIYNIGFFKMGAFAVIVAIIGFVVAPWLNRIAGLKNKTS